MQNITGGRRGGGQKNDQKVSRIVLMTPLLSFPKTIVHW